MSEFKTLAYDFVKLRAEHKPFVLHENLDNLSSLPQPYINVRRERLVMWSNDYKILMEFAAQVLGKVDFTTWDIIWWYRKRAEDLDRAAREAMK